MIKINLLGEAKPISTTGLKWLVGGTLGLTVLIVGAVSFCLSLKSQIEDLKPEVASLKLELAKLQSKTKQVKKLEKKKEELNEKIAIIAKLKRSKIGPVRLLDDINMALPKQAWLKKINEKSELMKISGYALDNQTVSRFMVKLSKSKYVNPDMVDLVQSKVADYKGVKLNDFVLQLQVFYAGRKEEEKSGEEAVESKKEKKKKK
ncbi:MAG: hypothetical protein D6780_04015 [Candidatus Dadabacteria bacterium]|nr:MAG: hypothetical protein D6780_04015 [Candidatus Dadabacteria bacterium]